MRVMLQWWNLIQILSVSMFLCHNVHTKAMLQIDEAIQRQPNNACITAHLADPSTFVIRSFVRLTQMRCLHL